MTTEKQLIQTYIQQLSEKEKKAYELAIAQLETSFDISKSIGFLEYKKQQTNK